MIFFNFLINLLEAFIFPIFLSAYFKLSNKKLFILLSGTIQLIILQLFNYLEQNNHILTLTIIVFNILTLYIKDRKLTLEKVIITVLFNFVILLSTIIGMTTVQAIFSSSAIDFPNSNIPYIMVCIIGKLILFVFTYMIIKFRERFYISLEMRKWQLIIIFQLILVFGLVSVGYLISMNILSFNILYIILFTLIVLNFLFIFIIFKINKLNNENLIHVKQNQLHIFNNEKLSLIKNIKNEIDAIDHRLFYVIFQIDNYLNTNEIDKIHKIIDQYKSIILKHNMILETGNSIFDCLLSLKINDLILNNTNFKNCIFISKDEFYDDYQFVNFVSKLLEHLKSCNEIELYMNEESDYTIIKIIFNYDNLNIDLIHDYLTKELTKFDSNYKIQEKKSEIKIAINKEAYKR